MADVQDAPAGLVLGRTVRDAIASLIALDPLFDAHELTSPEGARAAADGVLGVLEPTVRALLDAARAELADDRDHWKAKYEEQVTVTRTVDDLRMAEIGRLEDKLRAARAEERESFVQRAHEMSAAGRDALGREVREVWVQWAREQPDPDPSWLVPYAELTDDEREVACRIGEELAAIGRGDMDHWERKWRAEEREKVAREIEATAASYRVGEIGRPKTPGGVGADFLGDWEWAAQIARGGAS